MNKEANFMGPYREWLNDAAIDTETKKELRAIADQPQEIEDRFYKELEFGTGGLRGMIGAGTNRMNRYTVGKATQGLANYLVSKQLANPSVVIAYDSRHRSPEFALEAALVLAGNGIRAYVFKELRPTPELSFAVRHLGASAGIVVTASHNPPEYNGYKVYNETGGQLVPHEADVVIREVQSVHSFTEIGRMDKLEAEQKGLLVWLGQEIDDAFVEAVVSVSRNPQIVQTIGEAFRIIYTPLHGTGNIPVRRALAAVGFANVQIVPEQELPDANFSTVKSPNPEEREAFKLALALAEREGADLIVGTDPDADRMGAVAVDPEGNYFVLTGNQSGAIMVHYLLHSLQERGELPVNGAVVKTIVTSELGAAIARSYGVEVMNTLTGFKYIGELMNKFERTGEYTFIFGYEESYGYLAGTHARDKDAVVASMLIAEAAAYYKSKGRTLYDVLQELYQQHGYYLERLESRTMQGKDGLARIRQIMDEFRHTPLDAVAGVKVERVQDFLPGINGLPSENVLKYHLVDGSWFCLRPSGTEPKIKLYFAVCSDSAIDSQDKLERLVSDVMKRMN